MFSLYSKRIGKEKLFPFALQRSEKKDGLTTGDGENLHSSEAKNSESHHVK